MNDARKLRDNSSRVAQALDPTMTYRYISKAAESYFQPDTLAKYQYFPYRLIRLDGEWGLRFAVLQGAIEDYQKFARSKNPSRRARHDEAKEWIFDKDHYYHFSFVNICFLLGLDPSYIHKGIKDWLDSERPYVPLSYLDSKTSQKNLALIRKKLKAPQHNHSELHRTNYAQER